MRNRGVRIIRGREGEVGRKGGEGLIWFQHQSQKNGFLQAFARLNLRCRLIIAENQQSTIGALGASGVGLVPVHYHPHHPYLRLNNRNQSKIAWYLFVLAMIIDFLYANR